MFERVMQQTWENLEKILSNRSVELDWIVVFAMEGKKKKLNKAKDRENILVFFLYSKKKT